MAKFTKGQKVMKEGNECYYIDGKVVEFVSRKGWDRESSIPDDYTSIGNNTYHYAKDKDLELITDYQHRSDKYHPEHQPINKTKQTTMQKLTSALKRVLSADKQTLYKAGVIGGDLELSPQGKEKYVVALFNNEGDHKKAVAEMVAMAQAELDEA